jgi:Mrp family chromosome partitioning ATPase
MDTIHRAMVKAREQAPSTLYPVEEDSSRIEPDRSARLIVSDEAALALDPKTLEANRIVAWNKRDPSTPANDKLRTKVLKAMQARGWSTLALTSPLEGCGKTTVAINLAFSMAHRMPAKVVLVDFDLRRPRVGAYLGIDPAGDLCSFLEGHGPLKTHLVTAGAAQLSVVSNQENCQNAAELLATGLVDQLVGHLHRERSGGIVIIDLPPLLATDDALAVLPRVDCALLVVGERVTTKADISEALSLLSGTNLLGIVLNQSRTQLKSYY